MPKPSIDMGCTTLGSLTIITVFSGTETLLGSALMLLLLPLEPALEPALGIALEDLRLRLFCCWYCCRSLEERRRRTPAAFTVENEEAAMHAATIAKSARNFLLEIPDIILVVVSYFVVVVGIVIASNSGVFWFDTIRV